MPNLSQREERFGLKGETISIENRGKSISMSIHFLKKRKRESSNSFLSDFEKRPKSSFLRGEGRIKRSAFNQKKKKKCTILGLERRGFLHMGNEMCRTCETGSISTRERNFVLDRYERKAPFSWKQEKGKRRICKLQRGEEREALLNQEFFLPTKII